MGWWGYDLLSGDAPMDTLGFLADHIGRPDGLYPLQFSDQQAAHIRASLEQAETSILADPRLGSQECLPVVTAAFLATGAAMSDAFRAAALHAARHDYFADGWNDGGVGRAATMATLVTQIEQHQPGQRIEIAHMGLLATMFER